MAYQSEPDREAEAVTHEAGPARNTLNRPVLRGQLTEQVADRIQNVIVSGELVPGDRLPALRDLARNLGVSQTVLREAIRVLEDRGLLEMRPGSGTYVSTLTSGPASDSLTLLVQQGSISSNHLLEVRLSLEVEIVGLAAVRAESEDLAQLDEALRIMAANLHNPQRYIDADFAFHFALAEATRNPLFSMFTNVLLDALQRSRELIWQVSGAPERGQRYHVQIFDAVRSRDVETARQSMREHLIQVGIDAAAGEALRRKGTVADVAD